MVYLYKKVIGGKNYYYLRASMTKNGKQITKDIAYLGSDPAQIKKKLSDLPQIHQRAIRKTYKTIHRFLEINYYEEKVREQKIKQNDYMSKKELESIEACKLHWQHAFGQLDDDSQKELLNDFVVDFSYNTASLEGNTITLKEAEHLLLEQRTPKDRTLREVYDLQNTKKIFFKLYANVPKRLTHELIEEIHADLMENIDRRTAYRTQDIRVTKSRFSTSPAQFVQTDMALLLDWYEKHKNNLHPVVFASLFHQKFERIHPFFDGNGRTGRMLVNIILLAFGYPPLILRKKKRKSYLDALSAADKEDFNSVSVEGYAPLVSFIASEYVDNYWNVFL